LMTSTSRIPIDCDSCAGIDLERDGFEKSLMVGAMPISRLGCLE